MVTGIAKNESLVAEWPSFKHISLKVWVSDLANADIDRPVSIAFVFIYYASLAQLVRSPHCHCGGQGFESPTRRQLWIVARVVKGAVC